MASQRVSAEGYVHCCVNCAFHSTHYCQRRSPVLVPGEGARFPPMLDEQWCGEWEAREPEGEEPTKLGGGGPHISPGLLSRTDFGDPLESSSMREEAAAACGVPPEFMEDFPGHAGPVSIGYLDPDACCSEPDHEVGEPCVDVNLGAPESSTMGIGGDVVHIKPNSVLFTEGGGDRLVEPPLTNEQLATAFDLPLELVVPCPHRFIYMCAISGTEEGPFTVGWRCRTCYAEVDGPDIEVLR